MDSDATIVCLYTSTKKVVYNQNVLMRKYNSFELLILITALIVIKETVSSF